MLRIMKRIIISIILLSVANLCLWADFEEIGVGARAIGMGNAFVGLSDDVNAMFYNPAGLVKLSRNEFSSGYGKLYLGLTDKSDLSDSFISFGYPLRKKTGDNGTVGIGYINNINLSGYYSESTMQVSYGRKLNKSIYGGLNIKSLTKSYGNDNYTRAMQVFQKGYSKSGTSIDLGLMSNFLGGYWLGIVLKDVNQPNMGLEENSEDALPLTTKLGIAYKINDEVNVMLDTVLKGGDYTLHPGVEKWLANKALGLRTSFGIGSREYKMFSLGASYRHSDLFQVDYALIYPLSGINNISGTHRLTLTLRFGPEVVALDTEKLKAEIEEERKMRKSAEKEILDLKKKIDELLSRPESVIPPLDEPSKAGTPKYLEKDEEEYKNAVQVYRADVKKGIIFSQRLTAIKGIADKYKGKAGTTDAEEEYNKLIAEREGQEKTYRKSMEYYSTMVKKGVSLTTRTGTVQQIIKKYKPYGIDIKEANKALLDISEEHYTEGFKYYSEKSLDKAIKEWESCLKLNPEHEKARASLKKAKLERGK